jgi:serine-type D-Ala-D-Ala carboxypeptidase/endopeptidase
MPDNFTGPTYTVDELYAFLSGYTLKYRPGTHYEYANVGFGLLGHALTRRAGKSYEALLAERVLPARSAQHPHYPDSRHAIAPGSRSRQASGTDAAIGQYSDAGRRLRREIDG